MYMVDKAILLDEITEWVKLKCTKCGSLLKNFYTNKAILEKNTKTPETSSFCLLSSS